MTTFLVLLFGAMAVAAAGVAVTRTSPRASARWMVGMLVALAGVFVVLEAYAVAALQLLVSAGATMGLFFFALRRLDVPDRQPEGSTPAKLPPLGVLSAVLVLVMGGLMLRGAYTEGVVPSVSVAWAAGVGFAIFAVGVLGVTGGRNVLSMELAVLLLLNGASLVLVGFSRLHDDEGGATLSGLAMWVAGAQLAVGLAAARACLDLRSNVEVGGAEALGEAASEPLPPIQMEGASATPGRPG